MLSSWYVTVCWSLKVYQSSACCQTVCQMVGISQSYRLWWLLQSSVHRLWTENIGWRCFCDRCKHHFSRLDFQYFDNGFMCRFKRHGDTQAKVIIFCSSQHYGSARAYMSPCIASSRPLRLVTWLIQCFSLYMAQKIRNQTNHCMIASKQDCLLSATSSC